MGEPSVSPPTWMASAGSPDLDVRVDTQLAKGRSLGSAKGASADWSGVSVHEPESVSSRLVQRLFVGDGRLAVQRRRHGTGDDLVEGVDLIVGDDMIDVSDEDESIDAADADP
jgi:hypothetical protein